MGTTTPLKDIYTHDFLLDFSKQVTTFQSHFNSDSFVLEITSNSWTELSLRQRMMKIATLLGDHLTGTYLEKLEIILSLHSQNPGFNYLFLPDFVSVFGLSDEHFDISLDYLKKLTCFSSAEFAIRPFINKDQKRVQPFLLECSLNQNEHIRRLASEGSRPRLPWGIHLKDYIQNPELNLPLLTNLKNDPSLYVRKSVANHLNDISKENPDLVIATCKDWSNHSKETDWIIKRACRTLVKKANPDALKLFGYAEPGTTFEILRTELSILNKTLSIGETLSFNYLIEITLTATQPLRLEFGINYMKANGTTSLKKFHISDSLTSEQIFSGKKNLSFQDLSTRNHYPGTHQLLLFCNGQQVNCMDFHLTTS
ncbi:hypothetical protein G7081_03505 [Vagococcus coleopterorum]|uniref:DNA alkylation repair protein n=1 Tax=Vagococcus coleopterorum TaxID=2714946 RepID=A0A6G8AMQ2_9ENTE|nr:hypothetical protein [Vagococcus coleopterorum]QIL46203.1 hypothetical protein G7081_03505 [Vagococcus coleopterorum]